MIWRTEHRNWRIYWNIYGCLLFQILTLTQSSNVVNRAWDLSLKEHWLRPFQWVWSPYLLNLREWLLWVHTLPLSVISQAIRGCYLKLLTNYFRNREYNNILPVFLIPPALRMHSTTFSSAKLRRYTMHLQRELLRMTSVHLILLTDLIKRPYTEASSWQDI